MINRTRRLGWLFFPALFASLMSFSAFTATPKAPASICVDADCATTSDSPASGSGIKWHPGHYIGIGGLTFSESWMTTFNVAVDEVCTNKNIKGFQITKTWASLEGPNKGDYSSGFSYVDRMLAKLKSCNKYLILKLQERSFGAAPTAPPQVSWFTWIYPQYLMTNSTYGGSAQPYGIVTPPVNTTWGGSLNSIARLWETSVMDRLVALINGYGARYDRNPNFEMFSLEETTFSLPTGTYGFSYEAYNTQFRRWSAAGATAFPHTQIRIMANYFSEMVDLFAFCATLGNCTIGGPDPELPLPNISRTIQANRCFRGLDGCVDRRGSIPWVGEVQEMGQGGRFTETASDLYTYQHDTMNASYQVWAKQTYISGSLTSWPTLLAFLATGPSVVTTCPRKFASCNGN